MKNDPETLTIRPPEADDGSAIAHLFTQLGYPAEGADVTERLLAPDPASVVLLASLADKVVGVLVWHKLAPLHVAPAWGLISALVVDEGARGREWAQPCSREPKRWRGPQVAPSWSYPAASSARRPTVSIWRRIIRSGRNGSSNCCDLFFASQRRSRRAGMVQMAGWSPANVHE